MADTAKDEDGEVEAAEENGGGGGAPQVLRCFVCHHDLQLLPEDEGTTTERLSLLEVHLVNEHKVIIPKFADWNDFFSFYRTMETDFGDLQLNDRCSPFVMSRFDKQVTYHVIDKERFDEKNDSLRKTIENDFLGNILKEAQDERSETTFKRTCLFCKKVFEQNRAPLFDHLYHDHNFFLGHPDNIINSNELLDVLEAKLKQLQCLYCEKTFKTWNVLKEHMRKKGHKMLNPNNSSYDKFYLVNYLCSDKNWKQIKQENDFYDEEWNDWVEEDKKQDCLCFFCPYKCKFDKVKQHMRETHHFDFSLITSMADFYDRIKAVNFIRKRFFTNQCFNCDIQTPSFPLLEEHLAATRHITTAPAKDLFNQPEYYFPTYEDDGFLFFLDEFPEEEK